MDHAQTQPVAVARGPFGTRETWVLVTDAYEADLLEWAGGPPDEALPLACIA